MDLTPFLDSLRDKVKACEDALIWFEQEREARGEIQTSAPPEAGNPRSLILLAQRLARADEERVHEECYQCLNLVTGRAERSPDARTAPLEIPGLEGKLESFKSRLHQTMESMETWSIWVEKMEEAMQEYYHG